VVAKPRHEFFKIGGLGNMLDKVMGQDAAAREAHEAISILDNLLRTLMIAGAILIAGLIIAHPASRSMGMALVSLVVGFLLFVLASQFLIAMEMSDSEMTPAQKAKSLRLGIPFLLGWVAYSIGGILLCVNVLLR
jgi:hypothetical protein